MIPTTRGFLLLLLPAPLFALAAWEPAMRWMALGLLLVLLAIFFADWRLAGDARRFTLARRLKQRAIKEKVYPKHFPIPVLAEEFNKMVHEWGRVNETLLATKMFLRTNPLGALGMTKLGLGLLKTGRFEIGQARIQRRSELAGIMNGSTAH